MQLSLRSQLVAGVAAVGATAVAITPIAQPELLPTAERVSSAAVQLSAFANPVTVLLETLSFTSEDLLYPGELPALVWPASFYGTTEPPFAYAPAYFGLVPSLVNQFSFGAISAVVNNLSGYIDAGIYGTTAALGGVAASVWNTPFALVAAAQLALAGDFEAALAELQAQILTPLQDGITAGLQGVGYIVDNVINNVQTLIVDTVPFLVAGLVEQVVGAGTYLLGNVTTTVTNIVSSLAGLDFEGAWNAAINGLLGPAGLLGGLELLTVGIGVVETIEDVETVVYPSVRSVLTSATQRLGDFSFFGDGGILNDPFVPVAAAAAPAAAVAAEADAAAEVSVAAPAAQASAGDDAGTVTVADEAQPSVAEAKTDVAAGVAADVAAGAVAEVSVAEVKADAKAQAAAAGEPNAAQATEGATEGATDDAAAAGEAPAATVAEAVTAPVAEAGEATSAPSPERASRGAAKRAAATR